MTVNGVINATDFSKLIMLRFPYFALGSAVLAVIACFGGLTRAVRSAGTVVVVVTANVVDVAFAVDIKVVKGAAGFSTISRIVCALFMAARVFVKARSRLRRFLGCFPPWLVIDLTKDVRIVTI